MSYETVFLLGLIIASAPFIIAMWLFVSKNRTWSENKRYYVASLGLLITLALLFISPQFDFMKCKNLSATVIIDNHLEGYKAIGGKVNAGACRYRGIGSESEWGEWEYYVGDVGQRIWLK